VFSPAVAEWLRGLFWVGPIPLTALHYPEGRPDGLKASERKGYYEARASAGDDEPMYLQITDTTHAGLFEPETFLRRLSQVTGATTIEGLDKEAVLMKEVSRLAAGVNCAISAMRSYASTNPVQEVNGVIQDPNGVHAWLREFDAGQGPAT
jgi:hypothetical protein